MAVISFTPVNSNGLTSIGHFVMRPTRRGGERVGRGQELTAEMLTDELRNATFDDSLTITIPKKRSISLSCDPVKR